MLPPLPSGIVTEGGQEWVDVLLRGNIASEAVTALGGRVGAVAGEVMTVRVPLAALPGLIAAAGIEELNLAQPVEPQTDKSLVEIEAVYAWGGDPPTFPESGATGKGVIIGVIDTGLDVTHQDFRTVSGTRVLWLWDQSFGLGAPPPSGYSYGSEYSSSAINAGQYAAGDTDGHGTHIAGIAAGNGRATGNGVPAYTYMGAAPEANLVIVKLVENSLGVVTDDKIIDAANYVFQKAAAAGKPAVVLVAEGKMTGPHDGTDPLDLALSAMTGAGKIIVAAAGNYGNTGRHGEWTSTGNNQTGDITLNVASYTPGPTGAEHFYSEAWYNSSANYNISVVTPTGETVGPVARGSETTVQTQSGIVQISNGKYTSSNGSYRVNFYVYRGNTALPPVGAGTWTYRFRSAASGTQRVDIWLTTYAIGGGNPTFVQGKTNARLVCSPATATNVVSLGAYSTKTYWYDVNGSYRFYADAVLNDIAGFSSPGPRRDGAQVPTLAGPGYGVAGAMSSQKVPSTMWIVRDGVHRIDRGTSVAAAHAAGLAAMLLESTPTMTPSGVISQLQQSAASDAYTGSVPNATWGRGKLRTPSFLVVDVGDGPAGFAFASPFPNPTRSGTSFQFALSAEDLAAGGAVRLRIVDIRGREVARIDGSVQAGSQRLAWDGRAADGRLAPAGVYFAHLEVGKRSEVRRFVRLQ